MPAPGYGLTKAVGPFALWDADDVLGGFHPVATLADRDAIPFLVRRVAMWCWVMSGTGAGLYYCSDVGSASVAATWVSVSLGASAPSGAGFVKAASGVFSVVSSLVAADVSDFAAAVTARIAATAPTGDGFAKYISGVRQAAASLVNLAADVSGSLPATSVSGLTPAINTAIGAYTTLMVSQISDFVSAVNARITANIPTGTGFSHITAGTRDAAAKTVDLNSADVTNLLAPARGGGTTRTDFDTFTTTDASVVTVATSRAIPAPGVADVLATVVARTSNGISFRVDLSILVERHADGTYSTDLAEDQNGKYEGLLGVAAHLSLTSNTIIFTVQGLAATNITWVEPYFSATVG